jgi:hypothetical protein
MVEKSRLDFVNGKKSVGECNANLEEIEALMVYREDVMALVSAQW